LLSYSLLCRIDFKIKTIELDGKRIKLQIWVGPLRRPLAPWPPHLHAALARHDGRMPSASTLSFFAHTHVCVLALWRAR
jgi:hypothetical protein